MNLNYPTQNSIVCLWIKFLSKSDSLFVIKSWSLTLLAVDTQEPFTEGVLLIQKKGWRPQPAHKWHAHTYTHKENPKKTKTPGNILLISWKEGMFFKLFFLFASCFASQPHWRFLSAGKTPQNFQVDCHSVFKGYQMTLSCYFLYFLWTT